MTRRARRVAVVLQKGGTGKTTVSCSLARAASHPQLEARRPLRVLVGDLDPQGNSTATLVAEELDPRAPTIADAIAPNADLRLPLGEVIVPTIWKGVDLIPARTRELMMVETMITVSQNNRESILRDALEPHLDEYDLIVLDCPPALGMLTRNALAAVERALVVAEAERYSSDGLAELTRTFLEVRTTWNQNLDWAGPVFNLLKGTEAEGYWIGEILKHPGFPQLWKDSFQPAGYAKISNYVNIRNALDRGLGLDESSDIKVRFTAEQFEKMVDLLVYEKVIAA